MHVTCPEVIDPVHSSVFGIPVFLGAKLGGAELINPDATYAWHVDGIMLPVPWQFIGKLHDVKLQSRMVSAYTTWFPFFWMAHGSACIKPSPRELPRFYVKARLN